MASRIRSLLRRPDRRRAFATVDELLAATRKQLEAVEPGSTSADILRGQLAGAESEQAGLPRDRSQGSPKFRAGHLSGRLHVHLIRTLGALSWDLVLPTAAYAAALVTPPAERYLEEATQENLLKTHGYAYIRAEPRGDLPADVELELFRWLAADQSIPVTPDLLSRFQDWRQRRLDLLTRWDAERSADAEAKQPGS